MTPHTRIALITGGASGIGAAVARRWVASGGRVALLDADAAKTDKLAEGLGDVALALPADVRDDAAVRMSVRSAADWSGGGLDAAINCAGIARPGSASDSDDRNWTQLVDIHLNGTMRVNRACYPFLAAAHSPAIVNVSSVAGSVGMPGRSSYCAAKAGIEGLTRALAVEWAPRGIRVNAVAPGYVHSDLTSVLVARGQLDTGAIIKRTPLGRMADPDEIAAVICFLASPEASFLTGQTVLVDGGLAVDGNWYS